MQLLRNNIDGLSSVIKTEFDLNKYGDSLEASFKCFDSDLISFSDHDNDPLYECSVVEIFLDVGRNQYIEIEVAPNGAKFVAEINNEYIKFINSSFVKTKVEVKDKQYNVSILIDLLKFDVKKDIKFNAFRIEKKNNGETVLLSLSPTRKNSFHHKEAFVDLNEFLSTKRIKKIVDLFSIEGLFLSAKTFGNGHINSTYLITTTKKKYVLQRINNDVFKDVGDLMNNIYLATSFLKERNKQTLNIVKTKQKELYTYFEKDYYRVYDMIENSISYDEVKDERMLYQLGLTVAEFHGEFRDFNAEKLKETIPNFHNTPARYKNFLEAVELDSRNRKQKCIDEISRINKFEDEYCFLVNKIKSGDIKLAVTHNDTKINNVLFDKSTKEPICLIDLDTVMPGTYLYDLGDMFRGLFTGCNEDSTDLTKLVVNEPIFEKVLAGYLPIMKNVLNKLEISLIPFASFLMTMECGMRFLEDYLRGDIYFNTKYEDHNLIRARTQITLAESIYEHIPNLQKIIEKLI